MSNDTIYVLSMTDSNGESIFVKDKYDWAPSIDGIVRNLTEARVFNTKEEAWDWRETAASSGWQITPISAKRLFTDKLAGK